MSNYFDSVFSPQNVDREDPIEIVKGTARALILRAAEEDCLTNYIDG